MYAEARKERAVCGMNIHLLKIPLLTQQLEIILIHNYYLQYKNCNIYMYDKKYINLI